MPAERQIVADDGKIVWDNGSYDVLLDGESFGSIHPSLQRQAVLDMEYGLYEVVPDRIYQVRGFDLANITFVKGDTGWTVFDRLTMTETAAAAHALVSSASTSSCPSCIPTPTPIIGDRVAGIALRRISS